MRIHAMNRMIRLSVVAAALLAASARAQDAGTAAAGAPDAGAPSPLALSDEIAISPSRLELAVAPGTDRTVVVNIVYSSQNASAAKPSRLLASLGDWNLSPAGQIQFFRPGELEHGATKWVIYSPVEFTAVPGRTSQIRVTVRVPADAAPGEYTSVLFVEERPGQLKKKTNRKELAFHFRLSTIIYVQVPAVTKKGSLKALKAEMSPRGVLVTPTVVNEGNSHIRPSQSFQVFNDKNAVVAEFNQPEGFPILRESSSSPPLVAPAVLPPGEYQVRYRIDFNDGTPVKEGRTKLAVAEGRESAPRVVPAAQKADAGFGKKL